MLNMQEGNTDYILQAMVSMATADGDVVESEVATIRVIYAEISDGRAVPADFDHASDATYRLTDRLARDRKALARRTREDILRSAYRVLLADGYVAPGERKKLEDIAEALDIPEIHKNVILEDIQQS